MDMMKSLDGIRLQSFLTLFTRATPGTPASLSILIKQVIVYLFIYLFIYLSVRLWTANPQGLTG